MKSAFSYLLADIRVMIIAYKDVMLLENSQTPQENHWKFCQVKVKEHMMSSPGGGGSKPKDPL